MPISLVLFLASMAALVWAGGRLVRSLTWMARYLKLPEYTVAFILMAGATSFPELFLGVSAAFQGFPEISLGNLVGASVLDATFILGLTALIRPIRFMEERMPRQVLILAVLAVTPAILLADGVLSRFDGVVLAGLFFVYLWFLIRAARDGGARLDALPATPETFKSFLGQFVGFLIAVIVMLISVQFVLATAKTLADVFLIPPFLVGLMLLSIGTTLPELIFGVRSAMAGHAGLGAGNAVGSAMFNLLFILGLVSFIHPVATVFSLPIAVNLAVIAAVFLSLRYFRRRWGAIPRWAGFILVVLSLILAGSLFLFSFPLFS